MGCSSASDVPKMRTALWCSRSAIGVERMPPNLFSARDAMSRLSPVVRESVLLEPMWLKRVLAAKSPSLLMD